MWMSVTSSMKNLCGQYFRRVAQNFDTEINSMNAHLNDRIHVLSKTTTPNTIILPLMKTQIMAQSDFPALF